VSETLTKDQEQDSGAKPSRWARFAPPALALALAATLVIAVPLRWTHWVGAAGWQTTDDAYLKGDLTPISARVGGYVRNVLVGDYEHVRIGQVLVEIADDDYRAQVAQAEANVQGAEAAIENNLAAQTLQLATIRGAQAALVATRADMTRYRLEAERQRALVQTAASSRQMLEQADANFARTNATMEQGAAQVEAAEKQLEVFKTQGKQLQASLAAQRAALDLTRISLNYTKIVSPADGMVGERQVRPGQLLSAGSQVISVVPLPDVWVVANFKETQLTHARPGQPAEVTVDTFPGITLKGRIATIAPASGSQFALLPPDNATGNFTKVVQRVPVKIVLDKDNPLSDRLRPGLSVTARIDTARGGRREAAQ
jgi:membrane fusion protein (multidrug efflux system)